ncbi:hypothetical protein SB394_02690 [Burkholderia sp. BCCIQ04A]|uniref:Uncharacterized protein n=1 Tax=Burkholderia anthinoferrum TaxID=3090833 RepID=A0ABU5WTI2_9BURK|nr:MULTISPECIES: hypothetical protein [Burkholderia]MEB2535873.1 hypothetical protein [Burkholderia anthinoferrum]MEB2562001.1 hypothetical protein [Burkholderia anthinoferrum]MEB2582302.1 hypothetical protein [Burkholderia anthinoferrum]MDF3115848.1 hypothetical protein [Burkholderia semiarida]MEB2632627.1 hypothetical protein [Burkholderia anthinoferrum]
MTDKNQSLEQHIATLGAHCMSLSLQCGVITAFCKALIHTMGPEDLKFVDTEFRKALEGLLSLGDDAPKFAAHHPAVLAQANALLSELERRIQAGTGAGDAAS